MHVGVSHRRGVTLVLALLATSAILAASLIVRYNATHGEHRLAGTPFLVREGPSKTPARFAPWAEATRYGLIHFQRYAQRHLGGGIRGDVHVILNAGARCDGDEHSVGPDIGGETIGHTICLYLANMPRQTAHHSATWDLANVAAHEAAHVWAIEQGCTGPTFPHGLAEGMAYDLSWRAMDARTGTAAAQAQQLAAMRSTARRLRPLVNDTNARAELWRVETNIRAILLEANHPERYRTYCHTLATRRYDEPTARQRAFGRVLFF
jgi:hypothetical protein